MLEPLPRLRLDLDAMPSPVADRPGLLLRDPCRYSDAVLIVPPVLAPLLEMFNGKRTEDDLRGALFELSRDIRAGEVAQHLVSTLRQAGFLQDAVYARMKEDRRRAFATAPQRPPAHCGTEYPEQAGAVHTLLQGYLNGAQPPAGGLTGIAAPHVSPAGGRASYRAAYGVLGPEYRDRIFVILGTSHYGEPEKFGLTRKPFVTPLGEAVTETALVDELERDGGTAALMEDYCHAVEHSIEFQVLFLQHVYGRGIRILPILCGPFGRSLTQGGRPEDDEGVRRFLGALGEIAARERNLFWVLGVDMAHMGPRYGDPFSARANAGEMQGVGQTDQQRIGRIAAADADGFWNAVQENGDPLKWCGSSPFYTFLKAAPGRGGELLHYQQWNIDQQSVVSFGALAFR